MPEKTEDKKRPKFLPKKKEKGKNLEKADNTIDTSPELEEALDYVLEGDFSDLEDFKEIVDMMNEDLSMAQRMKKRQVLRKYKSKIKIARKRAMKRRANKPTIERRARKQAISNMKKFLSKKNNMKKSSVGEKNRIERLVKRRKKVIDRVARRLVISKRSQERKRFQKSDVDFSGNQLLETFNELYDSLIEGNK